MDFDRFKEHVDALDIIVDNFGEFAIDPQDIPWLYKETVDPLLTKIGELENLVPTLCDKIDDLDEERKILQEALDKANERISELEDENDDLFIQNNDLFDALSRD